MRLSFCTVLWVRPEEIPHAMTEIEHEMAALAQKLRLDETAASRLPDSLSAIALQLKTTPHEVVRLTAFAPPLLNLIATTCKNGH